MGELIGNARRGGSLERRAGRINILSKHNIITINATELPILRVRFDHNSGNRASAGTIVRMIAEKFQAAPDAIRQTEIVVVGMNYEGCFDSLERVREFRIELRISLVIRILYIFIINVGEI